MSLHQAYKAVCINFPKDAILWRVFDRLWYHSLQESSKVNKRMTGQYVEGVRQ